MPNSSFREIGGIENGRLLDAAEAAGFDVLVTVDQNIPDQQNLGGRKIALLILRARTNHLRDLTELVPPALAAIAMVRPGDVVRISPVAGRGP